MTQARRADKPAKSVLDEARQITLAIELFKLGARVQVLQNETVISRRRLIHLYKEIHGVSPPKGMLPFSTDWYIRWEANIHSSLFYGIYLSLRQSAEYKRMRAIIDAYRMYQEQVPLAGDGTPVLSMTRAWMLVRYFEGQMMRLSTCNRCSGRFVGIAHTPDADYVCGICRPPSRAGKKLQRKPVDSISSGAQ